MKIRNIRNTLLGSAIALAAGTAFAQQSPSPEELISEYDKDNNQSLSQTEFEELFRAQANTQQENISEQAKMKFDQADSDDNDELAMSELRRALPIGDEQNNRSSVASNQSQSDNAQYRGNSADSHAPLSTATRGNVDEPQSRDARQQADRNQNERADQRSQRNDAQANRSDASSQPRNNAQANQSDSSWRQSSDAEVTTADPSWQRDDAQANQSAAASQQRNDAQANRSASNSQQRSDAQANRSTANAQSSQSGSLEMKARQQPAELEGKEIQNSQDEDLGEIEQIVRHTQNGDLYVVVKSGGFAGFGENRAVIPVTELEEREDLIVFTGQSQELQEYEEAQYEEVTAETAQLESQERQNQVANRNNPR